MDHGTVESFYLVNADTDQVVRSYLDDGDVIVLASDGRNLNVCVRIQGAVNSVTMSVGGKVYPPHGNAPWCMAADDNGDYQPVPELSQPGRYTLAATPGLWTDFLTGASGQTARIAVTVVDDVPIGASTFAPVPPGGVMPPRPPPFLAPSSPPSSSPTWFPTFFPTRSPTTSPTTSPTWSPTWSPTAQPTTASPTAKPTQRPTTAPPTVAPTTPAPTPSPVVIVEPTVSPTRLPTLPPTVRPTATPTVRPTVQPTKSPTNEPTSKPTLPPVPGQTPEPTRQPTKAPTNLPTTKVPTLQPTTASSSPPPSHDTQQVTFEQPSHEPSHGTQQVTFPTAPSGDSTTSPPTTAAPPTLAPTRLDMLLLKESEAILDLWIQSTAGIMPLRAKFDFSTAMVAHIQQMIQEQVPLIPYLDVQARILKQEPIIPPSSPATRHRTLIQKNNNDHFHLRSLQQPELQQQPEQLNPLQVQVYVLSEYRSNETQLAVKTWMESSFDTAQQQAMFIDRLQKSRSANFFQNVQQVQMLVDGRLPGAAASIDGQNGNDDDGSNVFAMGAILIVVLAVAAVAAILVGGVVVWQRRQRRLGAATTAAGSLSAAEQDSNGHIKDSLQGGVIASTHVSSANHANNSENHNNINYTDSDLNNNNNMHANGGSGSPYVQEIVVTNNNSGDSGKEDDISTLGEPFVTGGNRPATKGTGLDRDERTTSVSGVSNDYDYAKAYLNYGAGVSILDEDTITANGSHLSSGRGRSSSQDASTSGASSTIQQLKQLRHQHGNTNPLVVTNGPLGAALFSDDDASFEQIFHQSDYANEEVFDAIAPAGKLGMVIDTPAGGKPVVHAIKPNSCLAGQVRVGDRLLSVDGEDVTDMNLVQVSNLITQKSGQERIFSFARNAVKR